LKDNSPSYVGLEKICGRRTFLGLRFGWRKRRIMIWYIVFAVAGTNRVMGLTRNCVVTSFTRMPESEFIEYIDEIVIPMIIRSRREHGEE